jgi:hypothetical protein
MTYMKLVLGVDTETGVRTMYTIPSVLLKRTTNAGKYIADII